METTTSNLFLDLRKTLAETPKRIPSKYFYDAKGDKLFQKIMALPEYYLTRAEYEIFENNATEIVNALFHERGHLNLVELGAGDGTKTQLILAECIRQKRSFTYLPVDVSGDVLVQLKNKLQSELGDFSIQPIQNTYFDSFNEFARLSDKAILFLGANIGNFKTEEANRFLSFLSSNISTGDALLLGIDLKKDPHLILSAYNDSAGVTKAFNLNLLHRLNKELDANFDTDNFRHYPTYDPVSGEARSYLVSLKQQKVKLPGIELELELGYGEVIHTEISRKYSLREMHVIAKTSGLKAEENWFDCKHYFTDILYRKM